MDGARTHILPSARGFTLIEIAIVLFIVGLVMSGIVAFLNAMVANRQIEATRAKQEAIKTMLISFISRNGRMPCPALGTITDFPVPPALPNPANGVEATPPGTCTGIPTSGTGASTVVTGVIPWVTLGLPAEAALDAYANRFTYQVVRSTTALNSMTNPGVIGRITIHSTGLGVVGPTGNQTNDCSGGVGNNLCAAVAVIVSHGKDGYGAYTRSGSRLPFDPAVTGNDARENANDDSKFVVKDFSGVDTNPFDDMVMALTPSDLLSPLVISGAMKDARAALNTKIEIIKGAVIANAYNSGNISGGNRTYTLPSSMPTSISTAQKTDPWNNTITYQKDPGQTNVNCSDSPSQLAFTLASSGPDGVFGTSDDIPYPVLSGEIINIIATVGCNK